MRFLQFPIFSILLGQIIGIVISFYQELVPLPVLFLCLPFGIALIGLLAYRFVKNFLLFFSFIWAFTLGLYIGSNYFQLDVPPQIEQAKQKPVAISGYVYKKLPPNLYNHSYHFQITSINQQPFERRVLLQISKKNLTQNAPDNYSKLSIYSTIEDIPYKGNLHGFNYQKYLRHRGFSHQINLIDPTFTEEGIQPNLLRYAYLLQKKLESQIQQMELSTYAKSIYKALLLGDRTDIEKDTYQKFSSSGAVHLLAISGLHIAIILIFLNYIFTPLHRSEQFRIFVPWIIIAFLWIFAFMTGMSPSVMRAVTMFSFVTISIYQQSQLSIYHHLATSMVVLLFVYPSFIFEVGFQLSYLAVVFIIWTQPLFRKWEPKNRIAKYFYGIVTVSIGAQIGVLPLSIFYFYQIPGLFLITNLFAIPIVTVLLFLGISILIIDSIGIQTNWLHWIYDQLALGMLHGIDYVSSVKPFLWKNIPFETEFLLLSYMGLFFLISLLHQFKVWKFCGLCLSICLLNYSYHQKYLENNSKEYFIVFNQRKENLMVHRKNQSTFIYSNVQDTTNNKTIQNYLRGSFAKPAEWKPLRNFYEINQSKVLWVSDEWIPALDIQPDVIILSNNAKLNLEMLIEQFRPKKIIADGTNYKATILRWQNTCKKKQIHFVSTYDEGFHIIP